MEISFTQVLIWIIIAALVGVVGELLARRRAPDGIIGAILVGLLAIFLIVGVFHFRITGEPLLGGVPLISSIIVAALLGASGAILHTVVSSPTMHVTIGVVAPFVVHTAAAGSSAPTD